MIELLRNFFLVLSRFSLFSFWGWCGGRTYVFILGSLGCATWLAAHGQLTGVYATVISILAGLFTARAVADDIVNKNKPQ